MVASSGLQLQNGQTVDDPPAFRLSLNRVGHAAEVGQDVRSSDAADVADVSIDERDQRVAPALVHDFPSQTRAQQGHVCITHLANVFWSVEKNREEQFTTGSIANPVQGLPNVKPRLDTGG